MEESEPPEEGDTESRNPQDDTKRGETPVSSMVQVSVALDTTDLPDVDRSGDLEAGVKLESNVRFSTENCEVATSSTSLVHNSPPSLAGTTTKAKTQTLIAQVQTTFQEAIFPQVSFQTDELFQARMKMEAHLKSKDLLPPKTESPTKGGVVEGEQEEKIPVQIDRNDGTRLHHAIQQTDSTKPPKELVLMITRETMKPFTRRHAEQGAKDSWTQMDKPGLCLDNSEDYELIPGPYFTADDWLQVRVEAAIIIQKYTRRKIAYRTAARMRAYAAERKEFWAEQEKKRKQEADDHLRYEIQRRMNPRTGEDFEILYTELATWCAQELKAIIGTGVTGTERRKAIKELLLKEIKLLQTIDKLRCKAARENRKERIKTAMEKMSTPKIWEMKNGTIVHVRTLGTARASDLLHLYEALAKPVGSNDDRMGVLGYVKWTVQVFNCPLTREILDLIEREADLMNRGRRARTLSGLRQRILNLFLEFVETPDFNPEAVGFQYVPHDFDFGPNQAPTRWAGTDKFN
ncbi:hypothetical protein R1flu_003730 [Riccia fluitans]|uniref:IQ motif and ubiquitin-like domain-containing protein n=1 Tax=Riccia fluitans TaxID=41844 RepID=A0ABD1YAF7_9MARC